MYNSKLIACRKNNNMTQKEVSKILGITKAAYSNIETGRRNPSLPVVIGLQRLFGKSIDCLLNIELKG